MRSSAALLCLVPLYAAAAADDDIWMSVQLDGRKIGQMQGLLDAGQFARATGQIDFFRRTDRRFHLDRIETFGLKREFGKMRAGRQT